MKLPLIFTKFNVKLCRSSRPEVFCKKETLAQMFSCEFYEILSNTFSYRTPPVFVSEASIFKAIVISKKLFLGLV